MITKGVERGKMGSTRIEFMLMRMVMKKKTKTKTNSRLQLGDDNMRVIFVDLQALTTHTLLSVLRMDQIFSRLVQLWRLVKFKNTSRPQKNTNLFAKLKEIESSRSVAPFGLYRTT
uniref:Uncharacterized protein n=1 Tax=Cacopsylla melanoneura TaxID=428564 RepID=A0A8D8QCS4_9HEMI